SDRFCFFDFWVDWMIVVCSSIDVCLYGVFFDVCRWLELEEVEVKVEVGAEVEEREMGMCRMILMFLVLRMLGLHLFQL
ncbi:hypothetical protein ABFV55_27595, partial [Pseudomonas syringae]|uniref:hypothetical protein n=1 Tax=Pseudomonas syringae TaxID=317 RepID=UPI0034D964E7